MTMVEISASGQGGARPGLPVVLRTRLTEDRLPDASHRKMRFSGMSAIRLKAGKITEEIGLADGVTALNQLRFIRVPVWPA